MICGGQSVQSEALQFNIIGISGDEIRNEVYPLIGISVVTMSLVINTVIFIGVLRLGNSISRSYIKLPPSLCMVVRRELAA